MLGLCLSDGWMGSGSSPVLILLLLFGGRDQGRCRSHYNTFNLMFMDGEIGTINRTLASPPGTVPFQNASSSSSLGCLLRDSESTLRLWRSTSRSDCFASLARGRVLLGQTQDPPCGPTAGSKARRSSEPVCLGEGNTKLSHKNPSLN